MVESDATGTPFGKSAACSVCFVPAEMSVTDPRIMIESPNASASVVVALGPLPKL